MKDFMPQVFFGMIVLGALAYYAMQIGYNEGALAAIAGVVYAVRTLANGKPKNGS